MNEYGTRCSHTEAAAHKQPGHHLKSKKDSTHSNQLSCAHTILSSATEPWRRGTQQPWAARTHQSHATQSECPAAAVTNVVRTSFNEQTKN